MPSARTSASASQARSSSQSGRAPAASARRSSSSTRAASQYVQICIGELSSSMDLDGGMFSMKSLKVPASFVSELRTRPQIFIGDGCNAYIFGRRYPLKEYEYYGSHGNDMAQTGIVIKRSKAQLGQIQRHPYWGNRDVHVDNDNLFSIVHKIRKNISDDILFVGYTEGGDVGMDAYIHRNAAGDVDSLILDNNFFHDFVKENRSD